MTKLKDSGGLRKEIDSWHSNVPPESCKMEETDVCHTAKKFRMTPPRITQPISKDVDYLRTDESPTTEITSDPFCAYDMYLSVSTLCAELDSCDLSDLLVNGHQESSSCHSNDSFQRTEQEVMCNSEEMFEKDCDGDTMLHLAIILDSLVWVSKIIKMAPDYSYLSIRNKLFQTPLHLAVIMRQTKIVRQLVCAGADVTAVDRNGNTPLHTACRDGLYEIARYLLEPVRHSEVLSNSYDIPYQRIPQDFDIANYDGLTCLHLAVMNKHMNILQLLIDRDVDLNMIERKAGRTVLHMACINGDVKLVRTLMSVRACNMDARTYSGYTPLDLARDYNQDGVYTILAAAGAKHGDDSVDSDSD